MAKVAISYSWTPQSNKDNVIKLADQLISDGVDVVVDYKDLHPGQDKYVYMEQMVTDPSIDKVLIICNKEYAIKAEQRAGGVGDEAAIITPGIYGKATQTKFIPVIFEKDNNGEAYLPAYLKSRIYIDMTDFDEGYKVLLDNIARVLPPALNTEDESREGIANVPSKKKSQNMIRSIKRRLIATLTTVALVLGLLVSLKELGLIWNPELAVPTGASPKPTLKNDEWKQLYIDEINKRFDDFFVAWDPIQASEYECCALIYINDDEIPELVFTPPGRTGSTIYTVSGNKLKSFSPGFVRTYIERKNLFHSSYFTSGGSWDVIYTIDNGMFRVLHRGDKTPHLDMDGSNRGGTTYLWNGMALFSESEYEEMLNSVFDESEAIEPTYETADAIIKRIREL